MILGCRVIDPKTKLDAVRNVRVKDGVIAVITGKPITVKDQTNATNMRNKMNQIRRVLKQGRKQFTVFTLVAALTTSLLTVSLGLCPGLRPRYQQRPGHRP